MAEQKFAHLHVHSHYSLVDGLAKIDELVEKAKEYGMDSLALTDHGVMYGAIEFYSKCLAADIKPIIGVEVYVSSGSRLEKEAGKMDRRFHLILLAKNEAGYRNLVQLVTKSHLEGFYYKPRVDREILEKHHEGLIALSAGLQGEVPSAILDRDPGRAKRVALEYQQIFGKGNFYLGIQDHPHR